MRVSKTGNKSHSAEQRIASSAAVMLRSGFAEQLIEADVLFFIKPKRIFITRRSGLLAGHVCQFSVGIHI